MLCQIRRNCQKNFPVLYRKQGKNESSFITLGPEGAPAVAFVVVVVNAKGVVVVVVGVAVRNNCIGFLHFV